MEQQLIVALAVPDEVKTQFKAYCDARYPVVTGSSPQRLHCALLSITALKSEDPKIISSLEQITNEPVEMRLGNIRIGNRDKLSVEVYNNQHLQNLHMSVAHALRPYFVLGRKTTPISNDPRKRELQGQYGTSYCEEHYSPHITVGKMNRSLLELGNITLEPVTLFNTTNWMAASFYMQWYGESPRLFDFTTSRASIAPQARRSP